MKIQKGDVLLIVDVQNDFISGSLAIPKAERIIPVINKYIDKFENKIFSADDHLVNHSSFVEQGGPWPSHCVSGSIGAELHPDLNFNSTTDIIVYKGGNKNKDAYSAFETRSLLQYLYGFKAKRLFICGLATDYCVKATVLDALNLFEGEVFVLIDAIKAVNVNLDDGKTAMQEMFDKGAKIAILDELQ